jgi:hypothetical protein
MTGQWPSICSVKWPLASPMYAILLTMTLPKVSNLKTDTPKTFVAFMFLIVFENLKFNLGKKMG